MPDTIQTLRAEIDALKISVSRQVGEILLFAGSQAPPGYLLADGRTIDLTNPGTAALAALLGATFNLPTDAVTVCRLPNLCGRTAIGSGQGTDLANRVLGQQVGEEKHLLAAAEIPDHTHTGTTRAANAKLHRVVASDPGLSVANNHETGWDGAKLHLHPKDLSDASFPNADHTHDFQTSTSSCQGKPHENMQPSIVLNYIIKL